MTYFRNVYERPDGTQYVGRVRWVSSQEAREHGCSLHARRVFVLRITEKVK